MLLTSLTPDKLEAGTDEAGRGCLAGPVFAAAVILPKEFSNPMLRDSKKLNHNQKELLFDIIKKEAVSYAIQKVGPKTIDDINILNASIMAMHKSLSKLDQQPELILVDGNRFKPFRKIPFKCIIKGDDKYYSIAAASVLAKVARDRYMTRMAKKYAGFDWQNNKGYPTSSHRRAIKQLGVTPLHRMSFRLLAENSQLDLFD